MARKPPLYPHVPKSREPKYPRGAKTAPEALPQTGRKPHELPTFKGYTVDYRLREFRRAEPGKALEFIAFDSEEGKELLEEMRRTGQTEAKQVSLSHIIHDETFKYRPTLLAQMRWREYEAVSPSLAESVAFQLEKQASESAWLELTDGTTYEQIGVPPGRLGLNLRASVEGHLMTKARLDYEHVRAIADNVDARLMAADEIVLRDGTRFRKSYRPTPESLPQTEKSSRCPGCGRSGPYEHGRHVPCPRCGHHAFQPPLDSDNEDRGFPLHFAGIRRAAPTWATEVRGKTITVRVTGINIKPLPMELEGAFGRSTVRVSRLVPGRELPFAAAAPGKLWWLATIDGKAVEVEAIGIRELTERQLEDAFSDSVAVIDVAPSTSSPAASSADRERNPEEDLTPRGIQQGKHPYRPPEGIPAKVWPVLARSGEGYSLFDMTEGVWFGVRRATYQEAVEAADKENRRLSEWSR